MKQSKPIFGIRKTLLGVGSVLLGMILFAPTVQAEIIPNTNNQVTATTVSQIDTIPSPIRYEEDITKEVGYHEVVETGTPGKILISETAGEKLIERIEPTAGQEVYGTKPKVEETITETAPTEYIANEELEAKQEVVKQEGQDGKTVTTTTYKLQIQETKKSDIIASSTYEGKTPFTIDNSQKLASDKIRIDEAAIRADLEKLETEDEWLQVLATSVEKLSHDKRFETEGQAQDAHIEKFFETHAMTDAEYADIKAAHIRYQAALDYIQSKYQGAELVKVIESRLKDIGEYKTISTSINGFSYNVSLKSEQAPTAKEHSHTLSGPISSSSEARRKYLYYLREIGLNHSWAPGNQIKISDIIYDVNIDESLNSQTGQVDYTGSLTYSYELGFNISDGYNPSYTTLAKQYLKHLDEQGIAYQVISENRLMRDGKSYEIIVGTTPAGGMTFKTTEKYLEEYQTVTNRYLTAFETHTKRYNNLYGFSDDLNIVFETTLMSEEDQSWFVNQVASLPRAIKQAFVKVTVRDVGDEMPNGGISAGMAFGVNNEINLNYPIMGSKERLLKVFFHELSHIIDYNAYRLSEGIEFYGEQDKRLENRDSVYHTYFNKPINQASLSVAPYYQNYVGESFAEFFSDYIMYRNFKDYQPGKFYNLGGEKGIVTLRNYDWGNTLEEIAENRANYEKYYNDPAAYSPMLAAEWWFAKLYTQLFEQETEATVVVDQITTQVLDVKKKVVEVGTKPQIVEEVTKYTTIEVEDANLLIGERKVTQTGRNGIVQVKTSYELVDKTTGEVVATTTSQVIQEMVQEIVAVGTKVSEPETEIPTDEPSVEEVPGQDVFDTSEKDKKKPIGDKLKTEEESSSEPVGRAHATIPAKSPMTVLNPSIENSASETSITYSRVARAKALPETGADSGILMSLLGFVSLGLGVGATGKCRRR